MLECGKDLNFPAAPLSPDSSTAASLPQLSNLLPRRKPAPLAVGWRLWLWTMALNIADNYKIVMVRLAL